MMEPNEDWYRCDVPDLLRRAKIRSIFVQGEMRPDLVVSCNKKRMPSGQREGALCRTRRDGREILDVSIRSAFQRGRSATASVAAVGRSLIPMRESGGYRLDHKLRHGHGSGDAELRRRERRR